MYQSIYVIKFVLTGYLFSVININTPRCKLGYTYIGGFFFGFDSYWFGFSFTYKPMEFFSST
jgi:hypothetical protein